MYRDLLFLFFLFASSSLWGAHSDYTKMVSRTEDILRKNPTHYKARFNRGYAQYKLGKYKLALQDFKKCYAMAEDDGMKSLLRYNMGNALFMQKKLKKALLQYRLGLILDNSNPDLRYNYTVTKMLLEQKKKNKNNKSKNNKKNKQQDQKQGDQQKQQSGKQGQPKGGKNKKGKSPKTKKGQMSRKDALRLLRALNEQEKKKMKRKQVYIRGVKKGKDW